MTSSYILLAGAVLTLLCARLATNWSKLRQAPGPTLAGYQQYNGRLREKLVELHGKHGTIVRYGVKSISITDPDVIRVAYGSSRVGFVTADSYRVLLGIQNGKEVASLVSTRDEVRHAAIRRSVAGAFTPAAVLDYEEWVDMTIPELLDCMSGKTTFDLSSMVLWYMIDAASRFSFGEPLGCLAAEGDVDGTIQLIRDRSDHWGWWSSIPSIERLVYRNPIAMRIKRQPSSMAATAVAKLQKRAQAMKEGKSSDAAHPDLLQRFLESSEDHPDALDPAGLVGMLMSTISGAGDTTATSVVATIYYLITYPETLRKLRAELTEAGVAPIPAFGDVTKLPYLNAVVKEGMRMFSTPTWPLERQVPVGGATIAGMAFPEGTSVGCMPQAIHQNKTVFGNDVDVFRPERWVTEDREALRLMESTHMGFSRGTRVCIGQHIAVLQMKKVIPSIIMKFNSADVCLGSL
ncbi:cytochrome P450 [Xylariaceae sp. FL1019]|nr:cytochrome P450 [Xylariaceae sp. FL1019]